MRADLKWHRYEPLPEVDAIEDFLLTVEEDDHACFFGYATMRFSEGVVFQLAANMGTLVEMIENFYGKKRMRDPKMATEVTKFRER